MSKIQHKLDSLLGLVKKGQELYDEYGETIISLANSIKNRNLASDAEFSVADIPEETAIEEFDEEVVTSMQKPTDIKGYREEIESDDSFHETLSTLEDAASIAFDGRITNPQEVCKALETLASVAVETIKYSEEQETKREEIRARRDVAIAQVSAMRDAVQTYLEKSFDERSILFAKQFECVDAALKAGDNDMLAISLNNINALAASSPFKALADINQVQKALTSSETEWDI